METWFTHKNIDSTLFTEGNDFTIYRHDCKNKNRRGVLVVIKIMSHCMWLSSNIKMIGVCINLDFKKYFVGVCYTPPDCNKNVSSKLGMGIAFIRRRFRYSSTVLLRKTIFPEIY